MVVGIRCKDSKGLRRSEVSTYDRRESFSRPWTELRAGKAGGRAERTDAGGDRRGPALPGVNVENRAPPGDKAKTAPKKGQPRATPRRPRKRKAGTLRPRRTTGGRPGPPASEGRFGPKPK